MNHTLPQFETTQYCKYIPYLIPFRILPLSLLSSFLFDSPNFFKKRFFFIFHSKQAILICILVLVFFIVVSLANAA